MRTHHKVQWVASLSNGESAHEEKGNYKTIPGELSPWQRLLRYMAQNNLDITSLSLITENGMRFSLPSSGKNPRFHAFAVAPKPVAYKMFRKMGTDLTPQGKPISQDLYTVAEGTYANGTKIQIWVHNDTFDSWSVVV